MADASRDQNRVTTLLGINDVTGLPQPIYVNSSGEILVSMTGSGAGDVVGPASSTDNAIARYDGTGGKTLLSSSVIIDDLDNVTGMTTLTLPNTGLHILDTNASHDLIIAAGSDLTADRTLTFTTGDANRTVTLAGDFSTAGGHALILTTSGATNVTLPTTGTLITDAVTTLSSLISVGTITTGTWNATDIPVSAGGTGLSTITALSIWVANVANTITEITPGAGNSIRINGAGNAWEAFTPSSSVPTTITVANEAIDTTCFVGFFTAATGDLGPKSNAGLTFNSSTAVLTATGFAGPLTGNVTGDVSGNAGTATALAIARTIGGVSFDGTANIVPTTIAVTDESVDTTCFIAFFTAAIGDLLPKTAGGLTFNSATDVLTAAGFAGPLTGNVTGDVSGNAGTVTGFTPASGTLTLAGAYALTLTTSADTNVTLPTTGTLATLAGIEELDNKTLDSSVGKGTWTASGVWTLPAITLGGDATLSENVSVVLDAALSVDGKYCGITEDGTAGAALAFGDLVYLAVADSRWELTDANAAATSVGKIGICVLAAVGDGSATKVLLYGKVRADAKFPVLTIGAPVYMSETAGAVVVTQPITADAIIRIVGFANTADELHFNPSNDYITHA